MFCLYRLSGNGLEFIAGITEDGYSLTNKRSQSWMFENEQEVVDVRKRFPELEKWSMVRRG